MDAARRIVASNRALASFFLKMGAVYAAWFVLYDLWLLPDGRLDAGLAHTVAALTGHALAPFYEGVAVAGRVVWIGAGPPGGAAGPGIRIEDGCNGLGALSLFVGFVLAYPGTARRRLLFLPAGLLVVGTANVTRCAALLAIQTERPAWFEAAHHYQGLLLFYVVTLALWVAWAHLGGSGAATGAAGDPAGGPALSG